MQHVIPLSQSLILARSRTGVLSLKGLPGAKGRGAGCVPQQSGAGPQQWIFLKTITDKNSPLRKSLRISAGLIKCWCSKEKHPTGQAESLERDIEA